MKTKFRNRRGELLLLIAAFIWGTGLVSQKLGATYLDAFSFGAARSILGVILLLPAIIISDYRDKRKSIEHEPYRWKHIVTGGLVCGTAYFLGAYFQQASLGYISAGKNGFVNSMYIIFIPVIGLLFHKRTSIQTWCGLGVAVVGLYLLCVNGSVTIGKGDMLALSGAFFWALEIIFVGEFVNKVKPMKLTFSMFVVSGVLSLIFALIFETPTWDAIRGGWAPLLYTAVMVVGVSYSLQAIGQKTTAPAMAGLIYSLEAVFGVIAGAFFLNERMTVREGMGCTLMFLALLISEMDFSPFCKRVK